MTLSYSNVSVPDRRRAAHRDGAYRALRALRTSVNFVNFGAAR